MSEQSTYRVDGMTCGGCVRSLTAAFQAAMPQTPVQVDLAQAQVTVTGAHDPKAVEQVVEDAGFDFGGPKG
ncbi:MAG: heavy-metal-associated domain-containing protein [Myxococcales bacterium]|nr:heavy-metal-associated domain-containing protein [Myxococcales bacterium]